MKIFYFLCLVALAQGFPIDTPPQNVTVESFDNLTVEDDKYIVVKWDKVENSDDADPILGYKIKVYEAPLDVKYVTQEDDSPLTELSLERKGPFVEVATIEVAADKNELTYHGMKIRVLYEVGVLAYTAKKDGPLSEKEKFAWV